MMMMMMMMRILSIDYKTIISSSSSNSSITTSIINIYIHDLQSPGVAPGTVENLPSSHVEHDDDPTDEYFPIGQYTQCDNPGMKEKVPLGQSLHTDDADPIVLLVLVLVLVLL